MGWLKFAQRIACAIETKSAEKDLQPLTRVATPPPPEFFYPHDRPRYFYNWEPFQRVTIGEYQSLYAFRCTNSPEPRVHFGYGLQPEFPDFYFTCLSSLRKKCNDHTDVYATAVQQNNQKILVSYLRHREKYGCGCSLAKFTEAESKFGSPRGPSADVEGAWPSHFLCHIEDDKEECRYWRKSLRKRVCRMFGSHGSYKHDMFCQCRCFGGVYDD